jgi:hypothetical protein
VAIEVSLQIVRTFIKLRQVAATRKDIVRRLDALEKKYVAQFRLIFDAIRRLMAPPEPKRRKIGFLVEETPGGTGEPQSSFAMFSQLRKREKCPPDGHLRAFAKARRLRRPVGP